MNDRLGATILGRLRLSQPPPLQLVSPLGVRTDASCLPPQQAASGTAAEDHWYRDAAVVSLLGDAVRQATGLSGGTTDVPAVLVQFWDTSDVPHDVAECIASWDRIVDDVPGLSRVMFDDVTARQFIRDELTLEHAAAFDACRHPAMRCDYFRLCFLLKHGGVYVDADEVYLGGLGPDLLAGSDLKLQPLCYNVATDEMVGAAVFLAVARARIKRKKEPDNTTAARDSRYWTHYVNNNPLVAPAGHPVVQAALERATTRLLEREAANVTRSLGVQSTTGPGNLTAALVTHALELGVTGARANVLFMENWDEVAVSRWPLDYRHDERNWRLWKGDR